MSNSAETSHDIDSPEPRPVPSVPPKRAARALGSRPRMSNFLRVLVLVTTFIHLPFLGGATAFFSRLAWSAAFWLALALTAMGILFFVGRARTGMYDKRRSRASAAFIDIPYFIHWCACLFAIVPSILATLIAPVVDIVRGSPAHLPLAFYMYTYGFGLVVCAYGIVIRRRWFVVKHLDVDVADLDPAFDGFTIAHLSDLHIGTTTPRAWGLRWAEAANGVKPDVTVVTGDLVTSGTDYYDDIADVIGALRAKDGVYVSMGNHDYFGDGEPLIQRLRSKGAAVLRNEGLLIERGGKQMYLAAIDDTWTRRDDMDRALSGCPDGVASVLLAHDPDKFGEAAKRGVSLVLSGHTHGGQVGMPFLARYMNLSSMTHHYNLGIYRRARSVLYVHPGLGTTGPPMRLGVAPAVVILTLRTAR